LAQAHPLNLENVAVPPKPMPQPQRQSQPPARWQQLMAPAWLADLLAGRPVRAAPAGSWRLFEIGAGAADAFLGAHIPGAAFLCTAQLKRAPLWNKVSDRALLEVLLANGIGHDSSVLLYGRNPLAAARVAHLMLYAGVKDVRLLDGGFGAWRAAGLPQASGPPRRHRAINDFGAAFPGRPDYMIGIGQARSLISKPDGALVSIRSRAEFVGATSGYPYIEARGDIPGARWGRAGRDGDVNCMSAFQHPDGTMKPAAEICAFWQAEGIHAGQDLAFYCGTGWRASLAFFYAWLMNWERISVYDGGWYEWSCDMEQIWSSDAATRII
jgi:molybdopterin synthase sulfurtransferase